MRIIGGQWGSRELDQPPAHTTRPMPDRVKQAIFDMLGVRFECPGEIPPILVGDFFSGSGSLGLEALSRGAKHCWFHEQDRSVLDVLRNNITALGALSGATVVPGDAWRIKHRGDEHSPYQLIFLDPPYRDAMDATENGAVFRFLDRIAPFAAPASFLVLHHPAEIEYHSPPSGVWNAVVSRRFGTNGITFFQR